MTPSTPDNQRRAWLTPALLTAIVLVGGIVLPRTTLQTLSDTMTVHSAVVDSLLAGHNWGRQALVGSLEYPLLPTLMLLLSRLLCRPFGVDGSAVMVGISQIWALVYIVRIVRDGAGLPVARYVTAALFLVFFPGLTSAFSCIDPNWVMAVPLSSAAFHIYRWHERREMRDALVAAITCGLLAFAGVAGIAAAAALLAVMTREVSRVSKIEKSEQSGVRVLIWAPFAYCLFLWFLWNWLVLDDVFFAVRPVFAALHACTGEQFADGVGLAAAQLGLGAAAAIFACFLCLGTPAWGAALCIFAASIVVMLIRVLFQPLNLYTAGGGVMTVGLGAIAMCLCATQIWASHMRRLGAAFALFAGVLWVDCNYPPTNPAAEGAFAAGAPARETVTDLMDAYWPRARVLVYGLRAPAIYHDPEEKRFVARVDFHEGVFLRQAEDEVIHLLVPPDNGDFYVKGEGHFSTIYHHGAPWLILEHQWASGWQLWRCVVSPNDESKLSDF